ncbi:hypothetical protein PF008_g11370 [Phytophthora fragariae]|uniref:DDE Tnp4 domain-containing protein n=1 Tax=Phytophthora fragariae TaxID=53985 RepID=A0A6G0RQZ5_9STRA|nr:hypothetical protein PF008_g11370 [Phytophthora fragariae]
MNGSDTAVVCAVVLSRAAAAIAVAVDGRSVRAAPSRVSTFSSTTFERAMRAKDTSWFHKKLRCERQSFLLVYQAVYAAWGDKPGANAKRSVLKRVALTMLYLAQGGTMVQAATVMGMSRSRAVVYINESLDVLGTMARHLVVFPNAGELSAIEDGFFSISGVPGVVGAIDVTLVEIPRPKDYEDWYCRKNFPAMNVQAVVDHLGAVRSISIRAGSTNDQSLWNGSGIRRRILDCVPPGKHLLGDAGYKIWAHLLTPFPGSEAVADARKRGFNKAHSRARIVAECAFGRLKNRFRVLLGKLEQKSPARICKVILGCIVLHNLLLQVNDRRVIHGNDPTPEANLSVFADDVADVENPISHSQEKAKRDDLADAFADLF